MVQFLQVNFFVGFLQFLLVFLKVPVFFVSPCISIVKPTRYTNIYIYNLFYFGMTIYMFVTVFPSIIRGSRLYVQQQSFVKQILLSGC